MPISIIILLGLIILGILVLGIFLFLRNSLADKADQQVTPTISERLDQVTENHSAEDLTSKPEQNTPSPAPFSTEGPLNPSLSKEVSSKIRILVVDDNADTIENVSRLIYFEEDIEVIGQAYTGREGLEMAIETSPHIILMDINMPDMDGITATKEITAQTPFSQVIIMSVQSENHYLRQAMMAGAREFQAKPFTADELVNSIRKVYQVSQPIYAQFAAVASPTLETSLSETTSCDFSDDHQSPIIAVYSSKGGIGVSWP